MNDIRITEMQLIDGDGMNVATFRADVNGINVRQMEITKSEEGLQVRPPRIWVPHDKTDRRTSAVSFSNDVYHDLRARAVEVYRLFSGDETPLRFRPVTTARADVQRDAVAEDDAEPEDAGLRRVLAAEAEACERAGL